MFEISAEIEGEDAAEALEAHFCEWVRSPWCLLRVRRDMPYRLFGYFDSPQEAEAAWEQLRGDFPTLPAGPAARELDDADWQNAYKDFVKPWSTRELHWVPVWEREDYPLPPGHVAVYLDAGMAFGTGAHETTRLCAERLLDFREARGREGFAGARVADAGCGSGILAISAARLGCGDVYGFDHDPESVRVSRENRAFNGLAEEAARFERAGIEAGLHGVSADLLLANIQADILQIHAGRLVEALAPGGMLCLSGILASEVDAVRGVFRAEAARAWGTEAAGDSRLLGEWCDLCFRRGGAG